MSVQFACVGEWSWAYETEGLPELFYASHDYSPLKGTLKFCLEID